MNLNEYLDKVDWYLHQEHIQDYIHNIIYDKIDWEGVFENTSEQEKLDSANKIADEVWKLIRINYDKNDSVPNAAAIVYEYLLKSKVLVC